MVMPPKDPPQWFELRVMCPLEEIKGSVYSDPVISADENPRPISNPLAAGMLIKAEAKTACIL